jgi:ankyrin repeat protein
MHWCVKRNYWKLLRALTGGGGGWDVQGEGERNPLCAQCVQLFQGVVQIDIQNLDGETALHLAAR